MAGGGDIIDKAGRNACNGNIKWFEYSYKLTDCEVVQKICLCLYSPVYLSRQKNVCLVLDLLFIHFVRLKFFLRIVLYEFRLLDDVVYYCVHLFSGKRCQ